MKQLKGRGVGKQTEAKRGRVTSRTIEGGFARDREVGQRREEKGQMEDRG
jgi:hypothetical protein